MTDRTHYDAIVIGAGQSGGPLASAMGAQGWKTAVIERAYPGGTCINWGCTPTKTMIASARVAHLASRSGDYGVHAGPVSVDLGAVRQRKRDMVESFREGSTSAIQSSDGVELIYGEARFTGDKTVQVTGNDGRTTSLTAERFFINTGTRNSTPPINGLESVEALDSTSIMELDEVPAHLVIIGGGYIGLEFGQMYRRFGSEVTIIQRGQQLLSGEDRDVADAVLDILRQDGITMHLCTDIKQVTPAAGGRGVNVEVEVDNDLTTASGSHLLVAAGRTPNTDVLDPPATGVELDDRGFIKVNERLETNVSGIWAMGEVAGQPAFTHISYDDFRIVRDNLLDGGNRTTSDRLLSYVMFTDPQLGRVGTSEKQAQDAGLNYRVASMPMSSVARALETDESRGLMKAIVDADTDRILGAAILGIEGGEVMSIIQTAMMGDLPYQVLRDAPFAHPTLAESLNNLFASFDN
jgi:pyruvate/2-oxoglutarate dehydrogenase complex dihydrolipoamide dehydrogenase (E3) component